jgi:TonB dependent receptor
MAARDHERTRLYGRRLAALLGAGGLVWQLALSARAQEGTLLRYEPPPVDQVYPEQLPAPAPDAPPAAGPAPGAEPAPPAATPAPAAQPAPSSPTPAPEPAAAAAAPAEPPAAPQYGARARVQRAAQRGSHEVPAASARDLPGAFGDPVRVLDSLPGVVPLTSGLPYTYIRGAPPTAVGYVYDDIPLPQLFHALFGPAVLHPRAMGGVRLYAGIPPARYGRRVGGAVELEKASPSDHLAAELDVRLFDVNGWIDTPAGAGQFTSSVRIGHPLVYVTADALGLIKDVKANYVDGQLRFRHPLGKRDAFELVYLGSFDSVDLPGLSNDPRAGASRLEFQRIETRFIHRLTRGEMGAALRFGYDESELGSALRVKAFTVGPRVWAQLHWGRNNLRLGSDLYTSTGEVVNGGGAVASPDGDLRVQLPTIAQASARNQGGVFAQGSVWLGEDTLVDLGLRLDYWSVQSKINIAADPRIRITHDLTDDWAIHAAFGLAHQPAVFLLPVPGLTDVALDSGLSRSLQSEVGVDYQLARSTNIIVQGYVHHYENLLLPELLQDAAVPDDPPLVSANAYGIEMMLKRDMSEQISGWISYTLAGAVADSGDLVGEFKPDFDVRHVLNTVLSWRVWRGLKLGGRMQARSGRVVEQLNPAYTQRLPWFVRVDARVGYSWRARFAAMTAYFEWLNITARREYLDADCLLGTCRAKAAPVITLPNIGLRAEF